MQVKSTLNIFHFFLLLLQCNVTGTKFEIQRERDYWKGNVISSRNAVIGSIKFDPAANNLYVYLYLYVHFIFDFLM